MNGDEEIEGDSPLGAGEGATSTRVGELDLARSEDRRMLAESLRRSWAFIPSRVPQYLAALDAVIRESDPSDPKGAQAIAQANRIMAAYHAMMQRDLHKLEEWARLDQGKPTVNVGTAKAPVDHDAFRARMLGSALNQN